MSDSVRPLRRQPTRLPCPWDSPGKNTGVGCHLLLQCMKVKSESEVAQSCPILSNQTLPNNFLNCLFMGVRGLRCFVVTPHWSQRVGAALLCLGLTVAASHVAPGPRGLTACGVFRTRGRTRVPCISTHCTTREVLK